MDITFWVTQDCNLNCAYCYNRTGNNIKKEYMTKEVVDDTLSFFSELRAWKEANTIYLNFHGGEPLMNTEIIEYVISKLNKGKMHRNVVYGMTTNGTIYGSKQKKVLEKIDNLSISLDGNKEIHDKYRLFENGSGTFETVISNAKEIQKTKNIRIRITVTKHTIKKLYETVVFLIDSGFRNIVPVLDMYDSNWEDVCEEDIINQFRLIKRYLIDNSLNDVDVGWISSNELTPKGDCDGGKTNFHIVPNGEIYPCLITVGDVEWKLGNVKTGLDHTKIDRIQKMNKVQIENCRGCAIYRYCPSSRCKLINKKITGDYFSASKITCIESRLSIELCQ
ncbi:radical SAM/SPASM domain-containing protein [Butyrivibrio sp. MC2013]|uniref:radical SAM/SPASM domain-containing protein n=1 Tax=Butyrivibrio sp. MC2013 TaxID=1280686 RepID=UPI000400B3A6|nr:radical SAM protein [Butyrivibrio sp. MC2013]